jgi:hypothetical protein
VKSLSEEWPIPRGVFPTIRNEKRNGLESIATTTPRRRRNGGFAGRNQLNSQLLRQGWQSNTPFQSQ